MPHFTASDDTRLFYQDWGTGRPIVLLTMWALGTEMWEYQVPALVDAGFRCVVPDRRGQGRSDVPGTGYDYDTLADDVAALLDHLDLTDVTLVGPSMSGGEAIRYLTRHGSGRISRIAIVSATLPFLCGGEDNPEGAPPEVLAANFATLRADKPKFMGDYGQAFFQPHLGNPVSSEQVRWLVDYGSQTPTMVATKLWKSVFYTDFRDELTKVDVPTLVLHGAADANAPIDVTGRRTAALIPGCQYTEYPTGAHGMFLTHAQQLTKDLLDFAGSPA